jgi:transcriptional regulator with XRE-family HTH domain
MRWRGVSKMMALAHDLNVNESAISRWRQDGAMSLANAARVAEVLDISMDWLILGRGEMDIHQAVRRIDGEAVGYLIRFLGGLQTGP